MSKSQHSVNGTINVLENPDSVRKKIKRAVTDSDGEIRFDFESKAGVSNLLSILGAAKGDSPEEVAKSFERYGDLKSAAADAVVDLLLPIQERYADLQADPAETRRLLQAGAEKAQEVASRTLTRAQQNCGLLQA